MSLAKARKSSKDKVPRPNRQAMVFKGKIYISGPRMGTNNTNSGIELANKKTRSKRKKGRKVNGNKKRQGNVCWL